MKEAVERGINKEGVLPGNIGSEKKSSNFLQKIRHRGKNKRNSFRGKLFAYTLRCVLKKMLRGEELLQLRHVVRAGVIPGNTLYSERIFPFR